MTVPRLRRPTDDARTELGFVLALGRALHTFGAPAHRLEEAMSVICGQLGLRSEFFSTPTMLMASFGEPEDLDTSLMRVEPGELNLDKLARLDALAEQVGARQLTPAQGRERLTIIIADRKPYNWALSTVAYALTAGAVVPFFAGSLIDVVAATCIGLVIGALSILMLRTIEQTRVLELVGAGVAAFASMGAAATLDGVSPSVVTIAAIIGLLPGLTLTTAMTELATRNLVSGTSRLMAAVIVLLELVIGVALGERAAVAIWGIPDVVPAAALPAWSQLVALAVSGVGMMVLVQANPRAVLWILGACALGFTGARFGASVLDSEMGVFVGAVVLGVAGNAYARWRRQPASVVLVPAVLLLVPGSLGFRGVTSLLERDTLSGVEATFAMFVVAVSIVAGLLVANATISPRRAL
jgi:uncharacterized membrane protein YjjP (DUF1212 family)